MLEILAPDRMILTHGDSGGAASGRFVRPDRDVDAIEVFHPGTKGSNRYDLATGFIEQTDPRHTHATKVHRVATDLREQLLLVGTAHDGLVALAQGGIQLGHAL